MLEAYRNEDIRPVPIKTVEQQTLTSLHRIRSAWGAERIATTVIDWLRRAHSIMARNRQRSRREAEDTTAVDLSRRRSRSDAATDLTATTALNRETAGCQARPA